MSIASDTTNSQPQEVIKLTKRKILAGLTTLAFTVGASGTAFAAPDFGPGNSQKGPQDAGAKCHPPGQTADRPECK